jgi:serine/threonine protein phosphatase PrpC
MKAQLRLTMRNSSNTDTRIVELPHLFDPLQPPHPFSSLIQIDFGAATHAGKVRHLNEDAYIIYRTSRSWEKLVTSLEQEYLPSRMDENAYGMAVADGVGGAAGGQVASQMAIRLLMSLILNAAKWALKLDNPETRELEVKEAKQLAEEYFRKVDQALLQYAEAYPRLRGMGTTLTGAYSFGDDLFIVHIGDSRAYLFRQNILKRLTHDQTVAQALADAGAIGQEEISTHRLRHTLTSCLGGQSSKIQMEIRHMRLMDGDRLLLCSDGLTDLVSEQEVADALRLKQDSQSACEYLLDLSMQKGGTDNITVLLAGFTIPKESPDAA